jgi:hypothetical protein
VLLDQVYSEEEKNEIRESSKTWIKYVEYVIIEIDTKEKTAIVIPV